MISKTRGIILKTLKYGESSLILDIYTEDFGLRSYIVGGVRNKKKGNKAGLLQIMAMVNLVAYHKSSNSLNRIKEIKAEKIYQSLPFEIAKSSVGLFMTEVTRRSITQDEQSDSLFNLLYQSYQYLDEAEGSITLFPIIFLLKLSKELGFSPADNYSEDKEVFDIQQGEFISVTTQSDYVLEPETSQYLYSLLFEEYGISNQFKISKQIRQELLNQLVNFYRIHIDNFGQIKSLVVLKEVFS